MATDSLAALSNAEIDAIGEVLNISMGSAATAVSTMLDRQVIITTPKVTVERFGDVDYTTLEPAMIVKIQYVQGISGSNVMVFRQTDMQIILNLLMGNEDPPAEDFVFDELSMSAACEVMNQMMGSSATALSEFLGKTINISTPSATVLDTQHSFKEAVGVEDDETIVAVAFNIDIKDVMNSEFISILRCDLAKTIVSQVMGDYSEEPAPAQPEPVPAAPPPAAPAAAPSPAPPAATPPPQARQPAAPPPSPMPAQQPVAQQPMQPPPMQQPAGAPPAAPPQPDPYLQQQLYPGYPPPYQGYPGYPPPYQGYPGYPPMPPMPPQMPDNTVIKSGQGVNVQNAQFPNFQTQPVPLFATPIGTGSNMELMMNVSLNVSVEIGKTRRKIREIMDFGQGTVIELEKQAGAPVDIVVNGQLIARGDVVVIDDNFGVRVTEIVGVKDLLDITENK